MHYIRSFVLTVSNLSGTLSPTVPYPPVCTCEHDLALLILNIDGAVMMVLVLPLVVRAH